MMINYDKIKVLYAALLTVAITLSISASAMRNDSAASVRGECRRVEIKSSCETMLKKFIHPSKDTIIRHELLSSVFDTLCYSGRPLRVLHIGDSHVAGKSFPMEIKRYLCDAFGTAESDSAGTGISFSYIAKNGATALSFLTPERQAAISTRHPDLIIMSFGTNECHGMGYRENEHLRDLSAAADTVRRLCPGAVIILTTPPGDYLSKRTKYYVRGKNGRRYRRYRTRRSVNPMVTRCAGVIRHYAEENGMPVWDLNTIAGAEMSVRNWQKHNMMRKDCVHFYPEGYAFQARLFGEAFVKAYNSYVERNSFRKISDTINKYVEY